MESPHSAALPPSSGPGAQRGQDGAAATAKLLRFNRSSQKLLACGGFPQFSPVLSPSVLHSFEKEEMGTPTCKTPQIRLEAGAGGRLPGAGGAWVFSLFFGDTGFTAVLLTSGSRAPGHRMRSASCPSLKGFPIPLVQSRILRVKNDHKMS